MSEEFVTIEDVIKHVTIGHSIVHLKEQDGEIYVWCGNKNCIWLLGKTLSDWAEE